MIQYYPKALKVTDHELACVLAGRLSYDVNTETKGLAVSVSDMLEGHDYHLRLCHKDFICTGTGAKTLVSMCCGVEKSYFYLELHFF